MTRERRQDTSDDNRSRKGNWYLLTGAIIGILLGLIISWVIEPVKYVDTIPASLRADFKDDFRTQIASSFYATNNFARAKARLDLLGDPDPIQALTYQAQNLLDNGDPTNTAYLLAILTSALKQNSNESMDIPGAIVLPENASTVHPAGTIIIPGGIPSKQPSLLNTPTLRPSNTPSPTPGAPFILKTNQVICDSPQKSLLLQVEVKNSAGQPIPGAEIIIIWQYGEEHFFTGLKPEMGDGYADYLMKPDVVYSIQPGKGGSSVTNINAPSCSTEAGIIIWGSQKLVFQQP